MIAFRLVLSQIFNDDIKVNDDGQISGHNTSPG